MATRPRRSRSGCCSRRFSRGITTISAATPWPRSSGDSRRPGIISGSRRISAHAGPAPARPAMLPELLGTSRCRSARCFAIPAYFRAIREQVVPHLRTYPSLKVWVAGCSAGEELYSLVDSVPRRGSRGPDLALCDRHQSGGAQQGRDRRSMNSTASSYSRKTIASRAESRRLSDYYTAAYGGASFGQEPPPARRVLRSQPGHRCVIRRDAAHIVPKRADLFRQAVEHSLDVPGHGHQAPLAARPFQSAHRKLTGVPVRDSMMPNTGSGVCSRRA